MAKSRPGIVLCDLISRYEFSVTPRSLFDAEGVPLECRDKSEFMKGLEGLIEGGCHAQGKSTIAIDCMGLVNQLRIDKSTETMSDLANQFVAKVEAEIKDFNTIILSFDNYGDNSPVALLKQQTWVNRYKDSAIQYNITPRTEIKKIKLKDLLSHKMNKELLCRLLAARVIQHLDRDKKQYAVANDQIIYSNIPGWSSFTHSQPESDTLIICLVRELCNLVGADRPVRILSPDTDVLMLAVYLASTGCAAEIEFELLNSKARRIIPVSSLAAQLGPKNSIGLLAAYILTGCDQIGKFNTVSKERAFKVFMT